VSWGPLYGLLSLPLVVLLLLLTLFSDPFTGFFCDNFLKCILKPVFLSEESLLPNSRDLEECSDGT